MREPRMVVDAHKDTVYLYGTGIRIERSGFMRLTNDTWIDIGDITGVPLVRAGSITTGILKCCTAQAGSFVDNRVRFTKEQVGDIIILKDEVIALMQSGE